MSALMTILSLRRILMLDALTCAVMAAGLLLLAAPVAALTGLPSMLLTYAGGLLVPVALFMTWTARAPVPPRYAVLLIVAGNLGWVLASLLVFVWVTPNMIGVVLVVAQAAVVLMFAGLEARLVQRDGVPYDRRSQVGVRREQS